MSLSCLLFMIDCILVDWLLHFSFDFSVIHNYMISHIVVLFGFRHNLYHVELDITVQFCFQHRANPYDQSHCCPISSSSQTTHCTIGLDSSLSYSAEITPIRSITLLSCLLFMMHLILSYPLLQFSSDFGVDRTYMINHVVDNTCPIGHDNSVLILA